VIWHHFHLAHFQKAPEIRHVQKGSGEKKPRVFENYTDRATERECNWTLHFVCASWQQRQKEVECGNGEGSLPYVH
jgi:hypothetical protein